MNIHDVAHFDYMEKAGFTFVELKQGEPLTTLVVWKGHDDMIVELDASVWRTKDITKTILAAHREMILTPYRIAARTLARLSTEH